VIGSAPELRASAPRLMSRTEPSPWGPTTELQVLLQGPNSKMISQYLSCGADGPEPAASGVTGEAVGVTGVSNQAQGVENVQSRELRGVQKSQVVAPNLDGLLTTFLQGFMTAAEVAKHLGVSRSTVYQLCERGKLRHVRVSNAIRVSRMAVAAFLREPSR
jgi:excisionase family DNA binding protein